MIGDRYDRLKSSPTQTTFIHLDSANSMWHLCLFVTFAIAAAVGADMQVASPPRLTPISLPAAAVAVEAVPEFTFDDVPSVVVNARVRRIRLESEHDDFRQTLQEHLTPVILENTVAQHWPAMRRWSPGYWRRRVHRFQHVHVGSGKPFTQLKNNRAMANIEALFGDAFDADDDDEYGDDEDDDDDGSDSAAAAAAAAVDDPGDLYGNLMNLTTTTFFRALYATDHRDRGIAAADDDDIFATASGDDTAATDAAAADAVGDAASIDVDADVGFRDGRGGTSGEGSDDDSDDMALLSTLRDKYVYIAKGLHHFADDVCRYPPHAPKLCVQSLAAL